MLGTGQAVNSESWAHEGWLGSMIPPRADPTRVPRRFLLSWKVMICTREGPVGDPARVWDSHVGVQPGYTWDNPD